MITDEMIADVFKKHCCYIERKRILAHSLALTETDSRVIHALLNKY